MLHNIADLRLWAVDRKNKFGERALGGNFCIIFPIRRAKGSLLGGPVFYFHPNPSKSAHFQLSVKLRGTPFHLHHEAAFLQAVNQSDHSKHESVSDKLSFQPKREASICTIAFLSETRASLHKIFLFNCLCYLDCVRDSVMESSSINPAGFPRVGSLS